LIEQEIFIRELVSVSFAEDVASLYELRTLIPRMVCVNISEQIISACCIILGRSLFTAELLLCFQLKEKVVVTNGKK
jgi:hypothetical protein